MRIREGGWEWVEGKGFRRKVGGVAKKGAEDATAMAAGG
jgi:hypothetical protein